MGSEHTRAGIDLLATDPTRAIDQLTAALEHNDKDAAALNALGFCNEAAGNLEAAQTSYLYAAAIDPRAEYGENLERVRALIERRKRIGAATAPKGQPK
jgi:tetratricopeptide (TPR) repeat protein